MKPTEAASHPACGALQVSQGAVLPLELAASELGNIIRGLIAQQEPLVVACDFDGVLAPLVDDPAHSRPLPGMVASLFTLAASPTITVALVSGRARADLLMVSGVADGGPIQVIGSHGAEFNANADENLPGFEGEHRAASVVRRIVELLTDIADRCPGAWVEVKPRSAVLHTRLAGDRNGAATAAAEAVAGAAIFPGAHVIPGKDVVEISIAKATKGIAVQRLRAERGSDCAVIFFGDDTTDETVFTTLSPRDIGIKVGPGTTAARYRVAGPDEVRDILILAATRPSG
ncbi:MAG: trehalose-phosphatase [Actinomycetota bacterium]